MNSYNLDKQIDACFLCLGLKVFVYEVLLGNCRPPGGQGYACIFCRRLGRIEDLKSLRTDSLLTSNMKCGYTIVPAGCCPAENMIALKVSQSLTSPCSPSSTSCPGSI